MERNVWGRNASPTGIHPSPDMSADSTPGLNEAAEPPCERRAALRRLGACPIHRRSFAFVRQVLGLPPLPPWPTRSGVDPTVVAAIEAVTD